MNGQMFHKSNIFAVVLTTQICKCFCGSNFLPKIMIDDRHFYPFGYINQSTMVQLLTYSEIKSQLCRNL